MRDLDELLKSLTLEEKVGHAEEPGTCVSKNK
jgi:hypothetical protein